ncbi:hypothetical protein CNMCM5793_002204 [Aspergillus hiratsukae]|uniref:USP domain-containing protein n=1 Tax=Aspergillus hiratsukae TaxID=1194566 RepID=A0A8H6P303_9EURO|nr:hypothetical protein CNMCM5793_002204 [Aspergillus hiratsukae]KAF7168824.1 hypothetical protein CNMCM6106_003862 [Aspergillus hiratsukae]
MAAAPLDGSSTPPDATLFTDSTRPHGDSMEDLDPQSTRKRPRLDSGSSVVETLSIDEAAISRMSEPTPAAPAAPGTIDHDVPLSTGPASRVTINVKSPTSDTMATDSPDTTPEHPGAGPLSAPQAADSPKVVSIASTPAQSPEIEVADLEDMDQDPNTSTWRTLGEALREPITPEVVQLQGQPPLSGTFPKLRDSDDVRENLEGIGAIIEKGNQQDVGVFLAVKHWFDEIAKSLDQFTGETYVDDRIFWEDLPMLVESLLRRGQPLEPDDGQGFWSCLEEFFINFALLGFRLVRLDTPTLKQLAENTDMQALDLMSRTYLPALGWMLQLQSIPFYRAMERVHGSEIVDFVVQLNLRIAFLPIGTIDLLSEFAACLLALVSRPQWSQLSSPLVHTITIVQNIMDSGIEQWKIREEENIAETASLPLFLKHVYQFARDVDGQYQVHIAKKSPWVTSDASESILRGISSIYLAVSRDWSFTSQVAKDLSIELPEHISQDERAWIIYYAWRFATLKKHIKDGRMELRVHGIETMQADLVNVWRQYIQPKPTGTEHPLVQFLVSFLRENKIVDYIVGVDSHPQLISRSGNVVGFLIVTSTYGDIDTDTIWKTVTQSQDPRTVSEVLGMLTRTFHMHSALSPALLYLCSKLLELPLSRFDTRMVEFCEQLLYQVREKQGERNRHDLLDASHVDAVPLRLCVRLIRESAAFEEFSVEHKAFLQRFASSQLSSLISVGLSESDKMETYERCIQDIAEMNQFTVGSIQALNALLPGYDTQEIRKLATDFDLTALLIAEMVHTVDMKQTDFGDSFSKTGFISRIQLLARIIDKVPDSITADLADVLWAKVLVSHTLVEQGRRAVWDMLCELMRRSPKRNPFIERCLQEYLPKLSPNDYSPELLAFAKQAVNYEVRFNPPPIAKENEVVSIPGLDRIWNFILTAPPGSIETDATNFAIEVYLDHAVINRSPRSAVEATHIALVDRCVEQLKSAAAQLKSSVGGTVNGTDESAASKVSGNDGRADAIRFSRSLLFLRQFLQGLRTRPQYSPPQNSPPNLPDHPVKGELIEIRYQTFNGSAQSKFRSLRIGDLATATELVEKLVQLTGFSKFSTITGGRRLDLLEKPDLTIRELKIGSGPLLIRKSADSREVASTGRRPSLTPVDSEVLKHFDDLYDLLNLQDHLARGSAPDEAFVSHSIRVVVAALTRLEAPESLPESPTKVQIAASLVECLLHALLVKAPVAADSLTIINSAQLVQRLQKLIEIGQKMPSTCLLGTRAQRLVCNCFAVLTEGSLRDHKFWEVIKQQAQLDRLLVCLLLDESRQPIRREIIEHIAVACSPSKLVRKPTKTVDGEMQDASDTMASENPVRVDMLATIWDAFVKIMPQTLEHAEQCQEFLDIAHLVFQSVAEQSPKDIIYGEYLKQWSSVMLGHKTQEFVGREPVDHLILGFCRLLRSCLDLADSNNTRVDSFDLAEKLLDNYLFPNLSEESDSRIVPQIPVMHTQTRQELYGILSLLCKYPEDYCTVVECVKDLIPTDYTYLSSWCFDRHKMIRSPEGYAGLKNLSNTCYLNSLLTQLFMNIQFRDFMLQLHISDPDASQRLLAETKKLFAYMQETWLRSVDPQGLVDTIRTYDNEPIDVTVQMDVDEFYNLLFDRWEAQISGPEDKKKFRSFYGGQLVQQIKSKECPHISERLEPFSAIQCDIKGKASLEESLQAYVEGEIMQGDNKYSCTSCGRHVDAVKRACLKEVPDNLIFHLKRFDFDMITMMRSKINDEFRFPEHIDMSPFKVEYLSDQTSDVQEDVFKLVGILVHSGTAESGHYYSYIRERPNAGGRGSWVEYNDSDVSRFDPSKIADQCFGGYNDSAHSAAMNQVRYNKVWNAYMLFYQRISSMESEKLLYKPSKADHPVHVSLPLPLANHIAMENEVFIRTYCLMDPYHTLFVRHLLSRLHDKEVTNKRPKLDQDVVFTALDTLEQLIARTREPLGLDVLVSELMGVINELPKGALRVLEWVVERSAGIRNLVLRSPHASVRESTIKIIMRALERLQELRDETHLDDRAKERWHMRYLDGFENVVATLDGLWPVLHTASRAWDDYFTFLLSLSNLGSYETEAILNSGFLLKCLEIVWLDREDAKRLKRQYLSYMRLVEKGRKFSHRRLMDLLAFLLTKIDLTVAPSSDDERRSLPNGKFSLTVTENVFVRSLGRDRELSLLRRILQQNHNPHASMTIVGLLLDSEPEAGLMDPLCKVLEDGLRVEPAELCAPYLEATLVLCQRSPDEDRIITSIDFVAKGIESINDSGGREHLAFFTSLLTSRNDRLGLEENWFLTQIVDKIPDWAPTLLIFPDKTVRNTTLALLHQILFSAEAEDMGPDWQSRQAEIAKELVRNSVEKLRKTFLTGPANNVEARVIESVKVVIDHCLVTYFDDSEEDQEFVRQAQAVSAAIDELSVNMPEELASVSDLPSPDEWEDNSMLPSDSEMGMAGSP